MEVTLRDVAEIFKALSDETRLEILALLLRGGELCVCDVEGVLGITQSKSSRHLRYLLNAGLVDNRREGVWMHYRVRPGMDEASMNLLEAVEAVIPASRRDDLSARLAAWLERKKLEPPSCAGC